MFEILERVEASSMENKKLRSRAIETIGVIIGSVIDCEDAANFKESVQKITHALSAALQAGLSDDDPQDIAIKEALINCAGFLKNEF